MGLKPDNRDDKIQLRTINEQICDTAQFCFQHKEPVEVFVLYLWTNGALFCAN